MAKSPREISVTLPLPPRACHPNSRPHWSVKAKASRAYRTLAFVAGVEAQGSHRPLRWSRADVRITARFRDARPRDRDNLLAAMKSAIDGLADAGIVSNDRYFSYSSIDILKDASRVGVTITVTRREDA